MQSDQVDSPVSDHTLPLSSPPAKHLIISNFNDFNVERILSQDTGRKSITVCGSFSEDEPTGKRAVVLVEKQPIQKDEVSVIFSSSTQLTLNFHNDIYGQYKATTQSSETTNCIGSLQLTTIYPATDKHIKKYSEQQLYMIRETPDDYQLITKPYIETQALGLQWVYNILDGKSEVDRVIYNDPDPINGFVLLPDLKWDTADINNLYLLAIVRQRGLLSLRDVSDKHLSLLKNIDEMVKTAVCTKYGIPGNQLRLYIHYQPSFYHLHVHVTHIKCESNGGSIVGRAHLLDDVIDNLDSISGKYYQKRALNFVLKEHDDLLKAFHSKLCD